MVFRSDWKESLPHRGHLVANRDRLDPDFPAPRRHADKTRLSHSAAARSNRESSQHERRASRPRRNRLPHNPKTLALHAPHHLWRRRTLRQRILEQNPRRIFRRRRRPMRQRRLHLGPGPRGRRNKSRRPPPKLHGNRKRPGKSSRCSRSRRSRPPRRNQRRSHRLLRSPARRPRTLQRTSRRTNGLRSQHHRLHSPPRRRTLHASIAQDAQRQNHAPPPPRTGHQRRRNRRHHHPGRHVRNRAPTKSPNRRRRIIRAPGSGDRSQRRKAKPPAYAPRRPQAPLGTPTSRLALFRHSATPRFRGIAFRLCGTVAATGALPYFSRFGAPPTHAPLDYPIPPMI